MKVAFKSMDRISLCATFLFGSVAFGQAARTGQSEHFSRR